MVSFYSLTFVDLAQRCAQKGLHPTAPSILFNWYYKKKREGDCPSARLSPIARQFLKEEMSFDQPRIVHTQKSPDKTVKFLIELRDGRRVESVLIPFQKKYTLCLSSQVGCAMGCSFCFTGKQGFHRHLKTEEIIGQFLGVQHWLSEHRPDDNFISNLVYMGQGEPLHNFEAVRDSAKIFISQHGLSVADHKITVSTAGFLPGLERWKAEMPSVNVALSLHSPRSEVRSELIPLNRKYPISDILNVIREIPQGKKRFATFEYLLIDGLNDSLEDAHRTGQLLKGHKAFINLIPFNPFPGSHYKRPSMEKMKAFKQGLERYGFPVTLRTTKGDEIFAACGQLNTLAV